MVTFLEIKQNYNFIQEKEVNNSPSLLFYTAVTECLIISHFQCPEIYWITVLETATSMSRN